MIVSSYRQLQWGAIHFSKYLNKTALIEMLSGYYTATLYVLKQHFKPVPTEQHQYELSEELKCHISSNETEM